MRCVFANFQALQNNEKEHQLHNPLQNQLTLSIFTISVIKVTPANPRLESGSSSSDDESDFEFEEDDGRLRVPQDDDEWEETDDDDEDNEDVIMKRKAHLCTLAE